MRAFISCNCPTCRRSSSAKKKFHKTIAHRKMRRAEKESINRGEYDKISDSISSGYRD